MRVYVLTFCPGPDVLYGNLPALRTLRTGFPSAEVVVIDNMSCAKATQQFKALCSENGYTFRQLGERVRHDEYLQWVVSTTEGTVAIVDPDVIFWGNCEHLLAPAPSDTLLKGRLIPPMHSATWRPSYLAARLHPSFMCIPDCRRLREEISAKLGTSAEPWRVKVTSDHHNPLRGVKVTYDTGARLYESLRDHCEAFTAPELDLYDHLFFGSHLSHVKFSSYYPVVMNNTKRVHDIAKAEGYKALRGIWRQQEQWFRQHACAIPRQGEVVAVQEGGL